VWGVGYRFDEVLPDEGPAVRRARSFATRLTAALALLLLAYGALVACWAGMSAEDEQESLQRLSHGLARHIVAHWPEITSGRPRRRPTARRATRCCRC
jgi:hypothetical protein